MHTFVKSTNVYFQCTLCTLKNEIDDFVKLNLEIDRTFVTPTNLLVYLTKLFMG
jgi:hypothetical protein